MITRLALRNFKSIEEQAYEFDRFDLLVGRNNSGKSTILQALAIWQFCVDEFRRTKRRGQTGKQVVLPNFTALPVPEFNLLWREKTDRRYPTENGKKKQEFILVEIDVTWITETSEPQTYSFGVKLRYSSPQTIYAIPSEGWDRFRHLEGELNQQPSLLPIIAYVPPFSGLEPMEERRDDGPLRKQVGKAQPGSVLRNLLLRVWEEDKNRENWHELQQVIKKWFSVDLKDPKYERGIDTQIICEYKQDDKSYDIISGGSGFHQALTLLAFFYGYKPTTILLDEPDAHLHVNLQREILDYFKNKQVSERTTQFLIATHAEEFIKGVDARQIISFLNKIPQRVEAKPEIIIAMADVSNLEITQLSELENPVLLYIEGETDERLLRAWAIVLGKEDTIKKVCFRVMGGGNKKTMKEDSDRHYKGVTQIITQAQRLMLFDYDSDEGYHPEPNNPSLYEWKRKNIENYLLVSPAWGRAALQKSGMADSPLLFSDIEDLINDFFISENLTLPLGQNWQTVKANVFQVVNGKKLLFENKDSLFQRLRSKQIELLRDAIATQMTPDEIHEDVHQFFEKLKEIIQPSRE